MSQTALLLLQLCKLVWDWRAQNVVRTSLNCHIVGVGHNIAASTHRGLAKLSIVQSCPAIDRLDRLSSAHHLRELLRLLLLGMLIASETFMIAVDVRVQNLNIWIQTPVARRIFMNELVLCAQDWLLSITLLLLLLLHGEATCGIEVFVAGLSGNHHHHLGVLLLR